ncbi:hypothetical protein VSH64_38875 [Amycolatopsis rhabdoformis]|uniref:Serine/threonine protein kinase n=1 Tax=Amycolatopsis rhabdoformis TaxID=1448059 RepID=A0ABZ1I2W8_9PSEU|nr:hypothetical protein [Amycolatopsis rhabdoformis]WSE28739.1 hypothetical protein VSH64_38875 [Amycolatopsis rhabdoformis]
MSKTAPTWGSVVVTGLAGFAVGLLVAALLVAGNSPARRTGESVPSSPPPAQPVTVTVTGQPLPPVTVTQSEPPPPPSTTTATVSVTRVPPAPLTGSPTSLGPTSSPVPNDSSTQW